MEYAEILRRHNQVASKILGDRECILFVTSFDGGDGDHYSTPFPVLKSASYVRIPQLDALYDDEDQIWIRVCGAALRWSEGEFEGLLREVADARGPHVLFADLETGRAYAPYDGGADIFVESRAAADELKQLWTEWLSARSDGL